VSLRDSWKKTKALLKKQLVYLILPWVAWFLIGQGLITLLRAIQAKIFEEIFTLLFIITFPLIWIIGFHKGGFLKRDSPQYIGARIIYGFTILCLVGMVSSLILIGFKIKL